MALRRIGWVCSIGLSSAFPLHTRQTSTNNSHSAKIIAPVVVVAVVCVMLVGFGWWKRRKRTQDLIQQLQTPVANTNNANNATTTAQTTPSTGADAPARPPRRRRRRRPSQISTKSLPAYNEQAGDEEIVLVRRTERDAEDESEDDSDEHNGPSAQASTSHAHAPDSRPLLDEDSSPDMPRVSLASSTHARTISGPQSQSDHPEQQSRAQSQLGHESIANTTTVASSIADTEPEPAAALPHGEVPSYTEAMSTSHVNLPSTAEHSAQPSGSTATDDGPPPADANATVRPKRKSVFRHLGRFNISKPSGSSTPAPEAVEMSTPARTSTSTHRPSISISSSGHRPSGSTSTHRPSTSLSTTNQHKPSPSLSSLSLILTRSQSPTMSRTSLNISAPIPSSLVRTELSYPRAGPTPEQIRFLSSRESLGRFGMPYGEEAIAAAKSRDQLPLPPMYKPRGGESTGASGSASGGGAGGSGTVTAQEDEPTITIRRGPMLLTPGELAQRKKSETAGGSDSTETDRPDSDPVLDPAMTITEEPIAAQGSHTIEEGSQHVQTGQERIDEAIAVVEEPLAIQSRDEVEPGYRARVRESPYDEMNDGRRESVMTTNSFVTATEGQGDSSPPTPTAETYHQSQVFVLTGAQSQADSSHTPDRTLSESQIPAGSEQVQIPVRAQTVLIPQSRDALHPELTLVPATPIG